MKRRFARAQLRLGIAGAVLAAAGAPLFAAPSAHASGGFNLFTISASPLNLLVGGTVTLSATPASPLDVVDIVNTSSGDRVTRCGSTLVLKPCIAHFTSLVPISLNFSAVDWHWTGSSWQSTSSNTVTVQWLKGIALNGPSIVFANGSQPTATFTANTAFNVGPTPYYTEIFDVTAGTRVTECPSGTSCSASVTDRGTHCFIAVVASLGSTWPPPGIQDESNEVCTNFEVLT